MPIYEYYCGRCKDRFEMLRPIARADEPATCPDGHAKAERVLSVVANYRGGGSASEASFDLDSGASMGGGCACGGGGCGC